MQKKLNGIVIAGGKSSRMGVNKALLTYKSIRLIDRAIQTIAPIVAEVLVSSNEELPNVMYHQIKDEIKDIGPIGGLYTCLKKSSNIYNLIIPCDVPYVDASVYNKLVKHISDYDAVVSRLPDGKIEPLVAIYSKSCLKIIEQQIQFSDYKLMHVLQQIRAHYVDFTDISLFKNFNEPSDIL